MSREFWLEFATEVDIELAHHEIHFMAPQSSRYEGGVFVHVIEYSAYDSLRKRVEMLEGLVQAAMLAVENEWGRHSFTFDGGKDWIDEANKALKEKGEG